MSIGKFSSPPPLPPGLHSDLLEWAMRLTAWLSGEESDVADTLEDDFFFGGSLVANRMFGFEDVKTSISPPVTFIIVTAPTAGKKKIVTELFINVSASGSMTIRVYKNKNGTHSNYDSGYVVSPGNGYSLPVQCVLDDTDEALEVQVTAHTSGDLHWNGSYLAVD